MEFKDVPYGKASSAMFKLLQGFGDKAGEVIDAINEVDSGSEVVERITKLALNGGYEPSTSHVRAREIMGKNLFGPDDAIKYFGVSLTKQQSAYLAEIPFSEETLVACKHTHILIAVFPMSILDIRGKVADMKLPAGQKKYFYDQDWYNKEVFAKSKGELGWHLVRKTPVDNSTSKTWDEQQALLSKDEETPSAQVMIYTIIAYFLVTGERLFEGVWVRCSDLGSDGRRVCVGSFDAGGLYVDSYWGHDRNDGIGVASARK